MEAQTISPRYRFALQQTSKGVWYVEKLEVNGEVEEEVLQEMKKFAADCMAMLDSMNKVT